MNLDFKKIMSEHTDELLIKIVTVDREKYQPYAIEAAENEISLRGIDAKTIDIITAELKDGQERRNQFNSKKVGSLTRFFNFLVDFAIWLAIAYVLTSPINARNETHLYIGYAILLASFIGYYYFMEIKFQKTVAKIITKTKVVTKDGEKPTSGDILRRTLCRLIPIDGLSFIFSPNGFHDRLSDTTVIKDEN